MGAVLVRPKWKVAPLFACSAEPPARASARRSSSRSHWHLLGLRSRAQPSRRQANRWKAAKLRHIISTGAVRIEPSTGYRDLPTQGVRLLSERNPVSGAPISLSHRSFSKLRKCAPNSPAPDSAPSVGPTPKSRSSGARAGSLGRQALAKLESERRLDELFARSQELLARMADEARREYRADSPSR